MIIRAQMWHPFSELHIPHAQRVPLTIPYSLDLNRKSLPSYISYLVS